MTNNMKVSDYIARFLKEKNVKYAFSITGGAIVHVLDSISKEKGIDYFCTHHEQAGAMAADAYAKVSEDIGVAIATSGPGATNLLTGVCCSYFDSSPTLFITGQAPGSQLRGKSLVRQIGFQETNVKDTYAPNTKYSSLITDKNQIRYELEKAFYFAKEGRPGPVLLDITDDVQRAEINPDKLKGYFPSPKKINFFDLEYKIENCIDLIKDAKRPIVILGAGVRLSGSKNKSLEFIENLGFPVALTWAGLDLLPQDYPLSVRDFGVTANRTGNFAIQNSDLIIALGTRLDTHEIGSNPSHFAREAKKIIIDIDESELSKYGERGIKTDILINYDVKDFLDIINKKNISKKDISNWLGKISKWKERYPICPKKYFKSKEQINPYVFLDVLSDNLNEGDIIIPETGCNVTWSFQGLKPKKGQRIITSFNHSPMGYGIPAAIGASLANNKSSVSTIIGDGGFMMNMQELATIAHNNLPIKMFILNNNGYGMIKQTQETWLNNNYVASSIKDFSFPNFNDLADIFKIKNIKINNHNELERKIQDTLNYEGPVLCNVQIHPDSRIYPKLSFGKPIEDSSPLLNRKEFLENMIVEPLKNEKRK